MSSPIVGAYSDLGLGLLKAFGLEGRLVRRLTLDIPSNDLVTLTIEEAVTEEQGAELVARISRYNLVPEEPEIVKEVSDERTV